MSDQGSSDDLLHYFLPGDLIESRSPQSSPRDPAQEPGKSGAAVLPPGLPREPFALPAPSAQSAFRAPTTPQTSPSVGAVASASSGISPLRASAPAWREGSWGMHRAATAQQPAPLSLGLSHTSSNPVLPTQAVAPAPPAAALPALGTFRSSDDDHYAQPSFFHLPPDLGVDELDAGESYALHQQSTSLLDSIFPEDGSGFEGHISAPTGLRAAQAGPRARLRLPGATARERHLEAELTAAREREHALLAKMQQLASAAAGKTRERESTPPVSPAPSPLPVKSGVAESSHESETEEEPAASAIHDSPASEPSSRLSRSSTSGTANVEGSQDLVLGSGARATEEAELSGEEADTRVEVHVEEEEEAEEDEEEEDAAGGAEGTGFGATKNVPGEEDHSEPCDVPRGQSHHETSDGDSTTNRAGLESVSTRIHSRSMDTPAPVHDAGEDPSDADGGAGPSRGRTPLPVSRPAPGATNAVHPATPRAEAAAKTAAKAAPVAAPQHQPAPPSPQPQPQPASHPVDTGRKKGKKKHKDKDKGAHKGTQTAGDKQASPTAISQSSRDGAEEALPLTDASTRARQVAIAAATRILEALKGTSGVVESVARRGMSFGAEHAELMESYKWYRIAVTAHTAAFHVLLADYNIVVSFVTLTAFPALVGFYMTPWASVILWYAFLVHLLCSNDTTRSHFFGIMLVLSFLLEGVSHTSFVLELTYPERTLAAFFLVVFRSEELLWDSPLLVLSCAVQVLVVVLVPWARVAAYLQFMLAMWTIGALTPLPEVRRVHERRVVS